MLIPAAKGRIGIETAVEVLGVQVDEEIRSLISNRRCGVEGMLVAEQGIPSAVQGRGHSKIFRREVAPEPFWGEHRWYEAWDIVVGVSRKQVIVWAYLIVDPSVDRSRVSMFLCRLLYTW